MKFSVLKAKSPSWRTSASAFRCILVVSCLASALVFAQASESDTPVPILTGNAGFFTNIQDGKTDIYSEISPILLLPLGDHWLIESRAEFEGDFARKWGDGPFGGQVQKSLDYLEADYIANPYVTITVGRFLTPFGIYNERLYPVWIRTLPATPLIFPIEDQSSNGAMLRGGFPVNSKINLNYAGFFSTLTTTTAIAANRSLGGRLGFFLPGPRIEAGFSWQKLLQDQRTNVVGFHFAWQPTPFPLNLRSEYVRSYVGSGYWIEGAYRLSQLHLWQHIARRTEFVGRFQQFFVGSAPADEASEYELPVANTRESDFGLNYFLMDGLKASGSYGRQFSSWGNGNLWSVGLAYRFAVPLGRPE